MSSDFQCKTFRNIQSLLCSLDPAKAKFRKSVSHSRRRRLQQQNILEHNLAVMTFVYVTPECILPPICQLKIVLPQLLCYGIAIPSISVRCMCGPLPIHVYLDGQFQSTNKTKFSITSGSPVSLTTLITLYGLECFP